MKTEIDKNNKNDFQQKMNAFSIRCRQYGLKVTHQRAEVYKTLLASKEHPSADSVYNKVKTVLPNISLDTVGRTLQTLSRIGMAFVVEGSGDVRRFDGNLDSHQHFKCLNCKRIIDFRHSQFDNIDVPAALRQRVKVVRVCVYAEGLCENCLNK